VPSDAPFPPAFQLAFLVTLAAPSALVIHAQPVVSLTADEVARRAASSSFEVEAQERQREAARAGVDQAGYYPRLTATAGHTHLSDLDSPALGNVVVAPELYYAWVRSRRQLTVASRRRSRVRTLLFQNGRATGVELGDAEVELTPARLDQVSARVGLRVARVELAHAAALDVEE